MSHPLSAVTEVSSHLDWTIIASAIGIGLATFITTFWGWFTGKERAEQKRVAHLKSEGSGFMIAGATIQDNQSLHENTQSNRDLRDQIMMLIHCTERHTKATEEQINTLEDVLAELKHLRRTL